MIKSILIVGIGGMAGSMLRYVVYLITGQQSFPYATLFINIAGSFAIGSIIAYAARQSGFADWRLFLATGVCGGFTTFSAFSIECVELLQQNRNIAVILYAGCSVLAGMLAAFAGYFFSR